jgi:glutamyl-tRNA reductase
MRDTGSSSDQITVISHYRQPFYSRLHVLSFELRRLSPSSSALLGAALIGANTDVGSAEILRARLVWPLDDIAVIEKCNAVIVVATVSVDSDPRFVRGILLDRWLEEAPSLERVLAQIVHYSGLQAVEYLGEVAVGLRSVVLGDGQVYAQVVQGLRTANGAHDQRSPFSVISRRLAGLRKAVRSSTSLQEGNLSLERIAAERLAAELGTSGARIAIIGYGRTGQLMAEILSKETKHDLVVTNRTAPSETSAFPERLVPVPWGDLSFYDTIDAVVICVTNTPETRGYVERISQALADKNLPLVLDMSSPSITRQIATSPKRILQLDELAVGANASLEARQRGVNKAKQVVGQWAEALQRDLASSVARQRQATPRAAPEAGSIEQRARRKAQMLRAIRGYMDDEGFLETQTRCLTSTSRADEALRRSIRMDAEGAALGLERIYEIGPVWAPEASWAPSEIDETYLLAAGIQEPTDLDQLVELALGLIERSAQALHYEGADQAMPAELASRRLSYETAIEMLQDSGYAVAYGSELDFDLLHNIADVVRFGTGECLVAVTDCPEPSERFEIARHPKTGLAKSFRIVLHGWQVASGSLRELDVGVVRRRMVLSGAPPVVPVERQRHDGQKQLTGVLEVALDHLVARCTAARGMRA